MPEPTVGRIVHYRLTRQDVKAINRRYVDGTQHYGEHRQKADGSVVHVGNQHHAGDIVPLIIVRVWENEFPNPVAPNWLPGDEEPEFHEPLSSYGVNGQAFLDGNDSLWVTSAPHGDFIGAWNWPQIHASV